ncbi:phosphonate metabolism protein/1,5-bisphosphokinase (PRPP-forming) PhnN [Gymnodinialimonas sp. 57CJ19]|uniref:phosphonate metabolism protein/1,5-bisphosphokinase (PRPP-forming) PhnN n=1 Tax=Gymnodinialimonas sp. 57CJ19 TaxID=3138498 RepID=UPI00313424F8
MSNVLDPHHVAPGRFIVVVGPSGSGKDSVMAGICAQVPALHRARRVITRAPEAGGEDYDAVTEAEFATRLAQGAFALHWQAHGLSYGIPAQVSDALAGGQDVLANLSRSVLAQACQQFARLVVLHITATPDVLSQRLTSRGREDRAGRDRRLSRIAPPMPPGLQVVEVDNSDTLEASVSAAISALYPERGWR